MDDKEWQYLIDQGEPEPTADGQTAAHNKITKINKKIRNNKRDNSIDEITTRDRWASYLYSKGLREKK